MSVRISGSIDDGSNIAAIEFGFNISSVHEMTGTRVARKRTCTSLHISRSDPEARVHPRIRSVIIQPATRSEWSVQGRTVACLVEMTCSPAPKLANTPLLDFLSSSLSQTSLFLVSRLRTLLDPAGWSTSSVVGPAMCVRTNEGAVDFTTAGFPC